MVPVEFISKILEEDYEWDEATGSVYFYGYTKVFNQRGIFGPDSGIENIEGSVIINADGVILGIWL